DRPDDREPETRPGLRPVHRSPCERFERAPQKVVGEAVPRVLHPDPDPTPLALCGNSNEPSRAHVPERVVEEVLDHLAHAYGVEVGRLVRRLELKADAERPGPILMRGKGFTEHLHEPYVLAMNPHVP